MIRFSPLRYPGGKGKIKKYIKLIFEKNSLIDGIYVEPFAGGSEIALYLLNNNITSNIIINDINKSIYAFWYSVINYTDNFCRLINDTSITIEEWERQRKIQNDISNYSTLEVGFSTFFLNRTNRSGIIKAGVIGGKNQSGKWKINARFNKVNLISRVEMIANLKNKIKLYNLDAKDLILNIIPNLPDKTFVYLDPPYYVKGKNLYEDFYSHNDHLELSKIIKTNIDQKWIISYDNVPEIKNLYTNYRTLDYKLNYSAANRYGGSEIIIYCDNLNIPNVQSPIKLK